MNKLKVLLLKISSGSPERLALAIGLAIAVAFSALALVNIEAFLFTVFAMALSGLIFGLCYIVWDVTLKKPCLRFAKFALKWANRQ